MLTHLTTDRLRELALAGMARALEEQRRHADAADLSFEDRLAMLVDREALERDSKRLATRLRFAGLRHQPTPEDVDLLLFVVRTWGPRLSVFAAPCEPTFCSPSSPTMTALIGITSGAMFFRSPDQV